MLGVHFCVIFVYFSVELMIFTSVIMFTSNMRD